MVDRLLGGRGAQDGVIRVVARWEGCFHFRGDRDTMDGIPVYVVNTVAYAASCGAIGRWARGYWSCEAAASVVVVTEEESEPNSS